MWNANKSNLERIRFGCKVLAQKRKKLEYKFIAYVTIGHSSKSKAYKSSRQKCSLSEILYFLKMKMKVCC